MLGTDERKKGHTILRGLLALSATLLFAYLYALIREPFQNQRHNTVDMERVQFLFACFLLLLLGMPILR
jgi:hypothetical protein